MLVSLAGCGGVAELTTKLDDAIARGGGCAQAVTAGVKA